MVYSSGEAQVVNDPNAKGGQPYAEEQEAQNADRQGQKPLVSQGDGNQADGGYGQEDQNQTSQSPQQEKTEEVRQLEERLGYSTEQLGEQPQQQPQEQPQQDQQQPDIDQDLASKFDKYIEQKFGVPPEQIQQQFQELQQFKQQQLIQQQTQALKQEWGDAYDERIQAVKEYFNNRLTPEQQQALDNADGARLIWAKIQQEQQQNQPNPPGFQPQQGNNPEKVVSQPSTSYMYKKSDIDKMGRKEYEKNIKDIEYAIQNGLVDYNA